MQNEELGMFHNQKEGDFDPDTGNIHTPGTPEYFRNINYKESQERSRVFGESDKMISQIEEVVKQIKDIRLISEDKKELEILNNKKDSALKLIKEALDSAADYILSINAFDGIYSDSKNVNYAEKLKRADDLRTIKHNALISRLTSAIRFISMNFRNEDELNEDLLEKFYEDEEKRGTLISIQRISFSNKNILCPDSINLKDRKHVMAWALQIKEKQSSLYEILEKK